MSKALTKAPPAVSAIPSQAANDQELIRLWLRTKQSEKTRKEYGRDIAIFCAWRELPAGGFAGVKLAALQDYAEFLNIGRSPNTCRRMLASLKSLFSFAKKIGYLHFDVAAAITTQRAKNVLAARILSEEQVMAMIVSEPRFRNRLLIRLLYVTGARVSEARLLRWRDVQARETGGQAVLYGKGGKTRVVRLPARLFTDLENVRQAPERFIFRPNGPYPKNAAMHTSQIWRIVAAAGTRAGIPAAVSPHWLRHAHASHALARGANIAVVQETLGHESLQTTSKYTHARPDDSSSLYLGIG